MRINISEMQSHKDSLVEAFGNIKLANENIDSFILNIVGGEWESKAKDNYNEKYTKLVSDMEKLNAKMDNIINYLDSSLGNYAEFEGRELRENE